VPNNYENAVSVKSIMEEVLGNYQNGDSDANLIRQNSRI